MLPICLVCGEKYKENIDFEKCKICDSKLNSRREKLKISTWMDIAYSVAKLGTCDRKYVGTVIVNGKSVVATGVNGSIAGTPHCNSEGHLMVEGHCKRTIHAEMNAITKSNDKDLKGATLFTTCFPCIDCFPVIANSGVDIIVYDEDYGKNIEKIMEMAKQSGVKIFKFIENRDEILKIQKV